MCEVVSTLCTTCSQSRTSDPVNGWEGYAVVLAGCGPYVELQANRRVRSSFRWEAANRTHSVRKTTNTPPPGNRQCQQAQEEARTSEPGVSCPFACLHPDANPLVGVGVVAYSMCKCNACGQHVSRSCHWPLQPHWHQG